MKSVRFSIQYYRSYIISSIGNFVYSSVNSYIKYSTQDNIYFCVHESVFYSVLNVRRWSRPMGFYETS